MINKTGLLFIVVFLLSGVAAIQSAEVTTTVKYLSSSAVYIDAGRTSGIEVGDAAEVFSGDSLLARLEVIFIADNSASCKLLETFGELAIGDKVVLEVELIRKTPPPKKTAPIIPVTSEPLTSDADLVQRTRRQDINRVKGRIGMQYYNQNNLDEFNYDYSQPSFLFRTTIENIQGSFHDLRIKMRGRKTIRKNEISDATRTRWNSRIYEVSLSYDNPDTRFNYAIGRILSSKISGLGLMDGGNVEYGLNKKTSLGIFAGTEPDYETSQFRDEEFKTGAYVFYETGDYRSQRFSSTVSLAGVYRRGKIDREFIFTQNSYSIGSTWSFFQNADIQINRDWRKDLTNKSLQLSSFLMSARWNPVRMISVSLSYNNRQSIRTWDNHTIADSLFDDAHREGYRIGTFLRLPYNLRTSLSTNLRNRGNGQNLTYSNAFGLNFYDQWLTRVRFDLRSSYFNNLYNKGYQVKAALSREVIHSVDVGIESGYSTYSLDLIEEDVKNNWLRFDTNVWISRQIYASAYYEIYRGDSIEADRVYLDLGVRF